MTSFRRLVGALTICVALMASASSALAQQVDIIRGRVLGSDTLPIPNVLVTATTLSGNVSRTARTDRNGRYTISFPGGEGDYWVSFSGIGLTPRRYQVKRTADQEILIADARMTPATITLDAVQVSERAALSRADTVSDVSGTERNVNADETAAFLAAEQMGDLAAMASAIPGVQLLLGADGAGDAFSVFGLGGDQNNTQLNGLNFGDGQLPRDANVMTSLSTSPYDVSRGGFSGGQLQVRTRSGSNFQRRGLSGQFISPQLQWADRVGVATGQQFTNVSGGGSASGPIKPDQLFYNTSFQFDRNLRDLQLLTNSTAAGFEAAGVSADSVSRLLTLLGDEQIPFTTAEYDPRRINTRFSTLNSMDWVPQNSSRGSTYTFTLSGNFNRTSPVGGGGGFGGFGGGGTSLITPSSDGTRTNWGGAAQLRHSGLVGFKGIFTETTLGFSTNRSDADPLFILPSGNVRVNSQFASGSASVSNLRFGGSTALNNASSNTTFAGNNTLSWFSADNRHRVKLTTELRREEFSSLFNFNEYGSFSYNTLEDLQANRPASFTRLLSPRTRTGSQIIGAVSLGDAWRPTNDLQIQYGVRVDGNRFNMGPTQNPDVQTTFGFDNAQVPNRLYVSPRVGFSWTVGQADQLALLPGMIRLPRAVIRGGVGVFQNTPGTQLISGAIDQTGLPSGLQQLTCQGAATPIPDWTAYAADVSSIPRTCADGTSGTVFANSAPNVTLFLPDYYAQRSLRGNLGWQGPILKNRFNFSIDATMSRNQRQQGGVDINFPNQQQFTLLGEAGRPMFVSPAAIVPTTGQVAWRQARVTDAYGRVTAQTSDLESESRQLSLRLSPLQFNSKFFWSVSYVLTDVREQFLGFQSTVNSPVGTEWSRGSNFSRHQIQYQLNYNAWDLVRISWGGNFRSGFYYTPTINQDVNGDSYGNDRAFVFDPALVTNDPLLKSGLENFLNTGTREAVQCLRSQLGQFAARNSCQGPWVMSGNLTVRFNSLKLGLPQRASLELNVANVLNGIDRMVNGEDGLKGWGAQVNPANNGPLLFVRGFDANTQAFKYEVNERFGSTRPSQTTQRSAPMSFTLSMRWDLAPSQEQQQLLQQLDRGRTRPGNKPTLQQLRQQANTGLINPMQQILQLADSVKLTRKQADSLATLNRMYVLKQDSVWTPVARFLANLPDKYNHDDAYGRYRRSREEMVDVLIRIAPGIKTLLTEEQVRILPTSLVTFIDKRNLQGIRSGTQGDNRFGGGMGRR